MSIKDKRFTVADTAFQEFKAICKDANTYYEKHTGVCCAYVCRQLIKARLYTDFRKAETFVLDYLMTK